MPSPIPQDKLQALSDLITAGQKLEAIKLHRELTGDGLAEAKTAVEQLEASLRKATPEKFATPRNSKGCLGLRAVCSLAAALLVSMALRF